MFDDDGIKIRCIESRCGTARIRHPIWPDYGHYANASGEI
jgi:hypothetical protein